MYKEEDWFRDDDFYYEEYVLKSETVEPCNACILEGFFEIVKPVWEHTC